MQLSKGMTAAQTAIVIAVILVVAVGGTAAFFLSQGPATQVVTQTSVQTQVQTQTQVETRTQILTQTQTQTVTTQPQPPPREFKNLTLTYLSDVPISADPTVGNTNYVQMNVYETLTRYFYNGTVAPVLAVSWTSNSDFTEWTFKLRQGVKFHDGTPFNATAVKFSIERAQKDPRGNAFKAQLIYTKPCCEIIDPYTIKLTTKFPVDLPAHLTMVWSNYILSPSAVALAKVQNDTKALEAWFEKGNSDGTGPYILKQIDHIRGATMERFEGYWRGWKPNQVKTIIYRVILDNPVLMAQLLANGEADVTDAGIPLSQLPVVAGSPNLNIQFQKPWTLSNYIMFNVKSPPLNNVKVRQALLYAIPYDDLIKTVLSGFGRKVPGYIGCKCIPAGYNESITSYNFDMNKARQLLTEAGFPNGLGGVKLVATYIAGVGAEFADVFELIRPRWAELGVTLEVRGMLFPSLIGLMKGANPQNVHGTFWSLIPPTPYSVLSDFWETGTFWNFGGYSNPEYDRLIRQAYQTEARSKKDALTLYSRAQEILAKDAVGAGLYTRDYMYPISKRFTGWQVTEDFYWAVNVYELRGV